MLLFTLLSLFIDRIKDLFGGELHRVGLAKGVLKRFVDKFDLHVVVAVASYAKSILVAPLAAHPVAGLTDEIAGGALLLFESLEREGELVFTGHALRIVHTVQIMIIWRFSITVVYILVHNLYRYDLFLI